jgi:hypothetical protein
MQHPEYDSSLQLSITFSPSITSHLNSIKYRFIPGEPEQVLEYAEQWQQRFSGNNRKIIVSGLAGACGEIGD